MSILLCIIIISQYFSLFDIGWARSMWTWFDQEIDTLDQPIFKFSPFVDIGNGKIGKQRFQQAVTTPF